MAVHLVRARYWTINIMPIFEADAAVLGQNVGKKDKRQSVTACSYCFSFVEYIALKKECIKWTTVVNAKIEIKGWPGHWTEFVSFALHLITVIEECIWKNNNKTMQKRKKKKGEERKTERKKKGYWAGFEPSTIGSARLHFTTSYTPQRMKKSTVDSR